MNKLSSDALFERYQNALEGSIAEEEAVEALADFARELEKGDCWSSGEPEVCGVYLIRHLPTVLDPPERYEVLSWDGGSWYNGLTGRIRRVFSFEWKLLEATS